MKKRNKIALIIFGVVILVLLAMQTPLMSDVRGKAWRVWVVTVANLFNVGPIEVTNNVKQQMDFLLAENARLKAESMDYQRISAQIGSATYENYRQIHARVTARPIDMFHSQFVINRGARDGLIIGAPVVTQGSVLIGFITEIDEAVAVLQLLTHPQTSLSAEILHDEEATRGLVQGKSFTTVEMVTIPRDANVAVGQQVSTISQGNVIPVGLTVGTISELKDEEFEPYQKARLELPYNVDDLVAVTVLVAP